MKFSVIDKLIIKGFLGPCILSFFIVEFVLIMQQLWKVIDDILGKGYAISDFLELISYFAMAMTPMSLPLTVLLSSVMVYGDMAEKYELLSLKSGGVSFFRILRPGIWISIVVMSISLVSSNYLKPFAQEGFLSKLKQMKTNKLTFVFDEKIFSQDFRNYSIYIGKKEKDGKSIKEVFVYDHSDADKSVVNFIFAKEGKMYISSDQKYLIMELKDGYHLKELRAEAADKNYQNFAQAARPVSRVMFSKLTKSFELSKLLDLSLTSVSYKQYEMMGSMELLQMMDSLEFKVKENTELNINKFTLMKEKIYTQTDVEPIPVEVIDLSRFGKLAIQSVDSQGIKNRIDTSRLGAVDSLFSILQVLTIENPTEMFEAAERNAVALRDRNSNVFNENRILNLERSTYTYKFNQQFSWALICLIFLFIGAPAGAIMRKGGFGYPLLIAIGFYIGFIMLFIMGEKLLRTNALSAIEAAWLPCLVLSPFAFYLSWRSLNDYKLFDFGFGVKAIKNIQKIVAKFKQNY